MAGAALVSFLIVIFLAPKLIRFLVSNKRFRTFRAQKQIEWLEKNHDGFQNIVRAYEIGEPIAWDYIDGYMSRDKLISVAKKFRKEIAPVSGKRPRVF